MPESKATSQAKKTTAPKIERLTAVKGMNDILPPESARWEWLENAVREVMASFAYRNIRTPVLEHTGLFVRGIGEVTDIVEKEMYSFADRADKHGDQDHLTLRPENTASVVRAAIEHNLLYEGGKRLFYMGPMFRRERPQRGRYRQFHQIGAEALGFAGAEVDAELILLAAALWKKIGLTDWRLEINSLGQPEERAEHRKELINYFEQHSGELDSEAQRRLHSNPLRILDTKNPAMQSLVEGAPKLIDFLESDSLARFDALKTILDINDIEWTFNPRLVRGLDYYNLTVFEFVTDRLGAQGTICAGGRYDYLFEQSGGKPTPAVGWALGVERVLDLLAGQGNAPEVRAPDVFAVVSDATLFPVALKTLQALRNMGVSAHMHASGDTTSVGSMKSQFKRADASGAQYALVFGAEEVDRGQVAIKHLRATGASGGDVAQQSLHELADIALWGANLHL
jgi:histidyl-tRNA synthetase